MSRALTQEQFVNYYQGETCLCENDKPELSAMCVQCRETVSVTNPGMLHVIDNGTDEPLLQAMGEFRALVRKSLDAEKV